MWRDELKLPVYLLRPARYTVSVRMHVCACFDLITALYTRHEKLSSCAFVDAEHNILFTAINKFRQTC